MNIEKKNLDRARELLAELDKFESAVDILSNYDAKVYATFSTWYNHNIKETKKVQIPVPNDLIASLKAYVSDRIYAIKKELESM